MAFSEPILTGTTWTVSSGQCSPAPLERDGKYDPWMKGIKKAPLHKLLRKGAVEMNT